MGLRRPIAEQIALQGADVQFIRWNNPKSTMSPKREERKRNFEERALNQKNDK